MSRHLTLVLLSSMMLVGCQSHTDRVEQRTETVSVAHEEQKIDPLIVDVQSAPTPQAEADAITRLRKYETDHGLTYTVRTFRTVDNMPVQVASAQNAPVRTEVTIYRGREVINKFYFVPKDNRNLALFGS